MGKATVFICGLLLETRNGFVFCFVSFVGHYNASDDTISTEWLERSEFITCATGATRTLHVVLADAALWS